MSNVEKGFSYIGPLNGLMAAIAKKMEAALCENCGSEDVFRNSCMENPLLTSDLKKEIVKTIFESEQTKELIMEMFEDEGLITYDTPGYKEIEKEIDEYFEHSLTRLSKV